MRSDTAQLHSGRIAELEGLRGVLAWAVVAAHLLVSVGWLGPQIRGRNLVVEGAECAVDVFMLLSGFAITRLRLVAREPLPRYFKRRALRILPAYWIALAAGIAALPIMQANLLHLAPRPELEPFLRVCQISQTRFWPDLFAHIVLVHGLIPAAWLPYAPFTLLGVAWSLSLEEQFYAVAPAAVKWAARSVAAAALLMLAAALGALFYGTIVRVFSNAFLPAKAGFFVVGAMSYVALTRRSDARSAFTLIILPSAVLAVLIALGSKAVLESWLPLLVWCILLLALQLDRLTGLRAFLRMPQMQFLGRVSYSTYLFHAPVCALIFAAIWRTQPRLAPGALLGEASVLCILATLLVSHLSWRCIERPFQRLGRGEAMWGGRHSADLRSGERG